MRDNYSWNGYEWRVMYGGVWNNSNHKWWYEAKYWANRWALYLGHIGD